MNQPRPVVRRQFVKYLNRWLRVLPFCLPLPGVALAAGTNPVEFEPLQTVILEGTIDQVDWTAPQLQFDMGSFDGHGNAPRWHIVGPPVEQLLRAGWTRTSIKVGDLASVVIHPERSGLRAGSLVRIIERDGSTLETSAKGSTRIMPPDVFRQPKGSADDPMAAYYGNTVMFSGRNYEGRVWFNADNTLLMSSRDLQKDGSYKMRTIQGRYWVQKLQDKFIQCMIFDGAAAPLCHSPVGFERLGDKWEIRMPNGDPESRELIAGHQ